MSTLDLRRLRAVHTADGRIYHPADVSFELDAGVMPLSLLPVTCVICAKPVEGVRCPDCQPKIVTGEDG